MLSGLTDVKVVEGQRVYVVRQIDKFADELGTAPIYLDFYDGIVRINSGNSNSHKSNLDITLIKKQIFLIYLVKIV